MRYRRPTLIGTCLGIALTLAACSDGRGASTAQPSAASTTTTPASSRTTAATPASPSAKSTTGAALRALRAAARAVPQGRAYDLDRERRDGTPVWLVKVAGTRQRQFTLAFTADGTRLLTRRQAPHPNLDDLEEAYSAHVTAHRATTLAIRRHHGPLDELELDTTDAGTLVWQAEFERPDGSPVVVSLDARTGAVVTATPDS
jgi:Peptidase propeptide and YPEB domain